ncbi:N-acetylneuraminate synthase [Clostridium cellulovorans]|uniref:N-acetylneuraminate synthase n=1 Tax=Clostridium cellulovorans (strain ATCC 35296 / DSM 3052 / OCM 3 / 743B) TaxID=573061 RepID=D9SPW7_CLOC7|nr:N-acetylneuraminate synthase [Clostridium cellulovorans]ADL52103.1 N-acetylneuraminate synthase [Clostridium cellulovorans 743B]
MENKVFIIAEAGVNHNGDIGLAYKMIDEAKKAGVDAVKFQTFKSANLVSKFANKAEYQKKATNSEESQLQMLRKLELSYEDFKALKVYCENSDIMFLSTAFDMESIDFLDNLDMKLFKIPSGEITNLPYLRKINSLKKEVIISTGMSDLKEIQEALEKLTDVPKVTVLHCNTEYPTPMTDVNLRAMNVLKNTFNVEIGYSDHTLGIEVPIAAVAIGATVIEKHFTLDKTMEGPDHKASLEPDELEAMVKAIRNIESALGSESKMPSSSEIKNKDIARKSIVAKRSIRKGEIFTEENLTVKRPGNGISPMKWDGVIGTFAKRDFDEDELIEL